METIPETILTDKGLEFDNSAMLLLASELGIDQKRINTRHPQANGAEERLNRTIRQMLKKTQEDNILDWNVKIPFLRINYFNHEHFFLAYNETRKPRYLSQRVAYPNPNPPSVGYRPCTSTVAKGEKTGEEQ